MGFFSSSDDRKLSTSDKEAAGLLAVAIKKYGPASRDDVLAYAEQQRKDWRPGSSAAAHGLAQIAAEMEPGEVVSGTVGFWGRFW